MKRMITLSVVSVVVCLFLTANASAQMTLNWQISPNSNTGDPTTAVSWVGDDLYIGTATVEDPLVAQQPVGIYGAGAALPTGYSEYVINFDWEFSTWDSYNDPLTPGPGGHGYWDSFSATITNGNYYWNQGISDPLNGDVTEILLLEGGTAYGDGVLEIYGGSGSFTFTPPDGDQYYLNLVIDTVTLPSNNGNYPSWGEFTDVSVVPVPGAVLLGILGLGAAGLKLRKFS
jgi:hypothetical protein